ncbi:nicotinamide N-methyltransferase [Ixodes scapularis]
MMATSGGRLPPEFLAKPGSPPIPWKRWIRIFERYLLATGARDYDAERRQAMLLNCLGEAGQQIFDSLPTPESAVATAPATSAAASGEQTRRPPARDIYKETVELLEAEFTQPVNVALQQLQFHLRKQQEDLIQGQTLLDVGSGPMLLCSLVASRRFKHIVLSDLLERNRLELNKWLNNHEDAIDWTTPAETIAAFEGYNDVKKGASEIMERTRSAIRKVVPCDVLEPGVLPKEHKETFDVVLSSGCLDAVAADHESFRVVVCNVGTLLKPGGLLVITGAGGVKHYTVGAADFAYSNLTEDALKQAIGDAGFQIKLYRSTKFELALQTSDLFKFILVARRA